MLVFAAPPNGNAIATLLWPPGISPPLKHPTRWALTSIPPAVAEFILLPRPKVFRSSSFKELRSSNQNEQLSLLTGKWSCSGWKTSWLWVRLKIQVGHSTDREA